MEITVDLQKQTLVVGLSGELDHHTAKEVKDLIEKVIKNSNTKNLVFDFSRLSFMDSSGIGVIIGRYKLIRALGGNVTIAAPSKNIMKLLTMSGINKLIEICESKDIAIKLSQEGIS